MFQFVFVLFFFLVFHSANAITFEKYFTDSGTYNANCVKQTLDGGYLLFGSSYSGSTAQQVVIIKVDSNGIKENVRTYGGSATDGAISAVMTNDSNFMVAAIKDASINNELWILKVDQYGDTLWTKTIPLGVGRKHPTEIIRTLDNGYIICGNTSVQALGGLDAFLIKIDHNANVLWNNNYGGNNSDAGYSVKEMEDSCLITLISTASFGLSTAGIYLVKTDKLGDTIWTKILSDTTVIQGNSLAISSGQIYIGAYKWDNSLGNYDSHLYKLDSNGNLIFDIPFLNNFENGILNIQITNDGNIITAGSTMTSLNSYDVALSKIDTNGIILWTRQFGGINEEQSFFVQQTFDSGFVVCGSTHSFVPNAAYLVKVDSLGQITTNVQEIEEKVLSVFPNPASNFLEIDLTKCKFSSFNFSLINSLGQPVIRGKINSAKNFIVDVDELKRGFYILIFYNDERLFYTSKIILH